MRQVLVDHARRRMAEKRGGGRERVTLESERLGGAEGRVDVDRTAAELIDLDRALEELARLNPRHARVVECRFFGGMAVDETAEALGVSPRTVKYDWALARAWLHDALLGSAAAGESDTSDTSDAS
jgi:RNA polymerase sigma factor (TIGR02999 family)